MRQALLSLKRAIARHRAFVAVTLLAAALAALPALNPVTIGPSDPSVQQQAFRADHSFAEARDVLASHRELIELGERLLAESGPDPALERMQERLHRETAILARIVGASDASAYWGAYAELHEVYAEGNDGMCTYWDARAIFERALSELASPTVYRLPHTMPALVYLTSDLFVLAPLILSPWGAWLLPHDAPGYDGSLDFAVWMVPLAAGVLAGVGSMAPLRSARTSGDAWARDLGRAWVRATVWGAGAALAVTLPGAIAAALRNGIGDPSYPIVFLTRGNTIASTTVGAVLMERGALVLGIAALASAVALALRALTRSRIPSAAVFASSIALAAQSWYFAPLSPLRGAAPLLPTSYLDPSRATGAAQAGVTALPAVGYGGVHAHTGIAIAAGCTALLLFCTLTSELLARSAARWLSLHGRSGWAMRLPPTFRRVLYRIGEAPRARTSRAPGDPLAHGPPALAPAQLNTPPYTAWCRLVSLTHSRIPPPTPEDERSRERKRDDSHDECSWSAPPTEHAHRFGGASPHRALRVRARPRHGQEPPALGPHRHRGAAGMPRPCHAAGAVGPHPVQPRRCIGGSLPRH